MAATEVRVEAEEGVEEGAEGSEVVEIGQEVQDAS